MLKMYETISTKAIEGKGPDLNVFKNEWGQ